VALLFVVAAAIVAAAVTRGATHQTHGSICGAVGVVPSASVRTASAYFLETG